MLKRHVLSFCKAVEIFFKLLLSRNGIKRKKKMALVYCSSQLNLSKESGMVGQSQI